MALLIVMPVISFGVAYFGGWILKVFIGVAVAAGLNMVFDTARFAPDMIPLFCATLAMIGSYFKATQTNNNNNSKSA